VISGVFFDKKLYFQQHIYYYANKVLFTIEDIKMVGNSIRELSPMYKHPLYRICVFSTTLYGFQLWYFKEALLYQPLKELKKCKEE